MSKIENVKEQNFEVMQKFLKTITSENYKLNHETSLRLFLDIWNHGIRTAKPKGIIWTFDKSISKLTINDVLEFFDFLNTDTKKYSIATKRTRLIHVKNFCKFLVQRHLKLEPIDKMYWKAELNDKDNWKFGRKGHKEPETYYRDNVMTLDELEQVLTYLYDNNKQKYLVFRLLAETGMRKAELIKIDIERNDRGKIIPLEEDLKQRRLVVMGKMRDGDKYVISEILQRQLLNYLENTRLNPEYISKYKIETKAFFVSQQGNRFNHTSLNYVLMGTKNKDGSIKRKGVVHYLSLEKHITPHTFRKTLNTERKKMGCSDGDLEYLLNHKVSTNRDQYTKLSWSERVKLFDQYYPYKKKFRDLI